MNFCPPKPGLTLSLIHIYYKLAYLNRCARMYHRDKNHPCVVVWSLGNESQFGENHVAMADYLHENDTRPVHYEGGYDALCLDIVSRMYTHHEQIGEMCRQHKGQMCIRDSYYPEVFEQIKERVKEGRWEIVGPMWVESDCNVVSGESLVRQVL